jgi:hypothetical protein
MRIHQSLRERLAPLSQTISRREILFLLEAYTALLRAGTEVEADDAWREQVRENGGMLLSLEGLQPDKGNESIYLVREVLTGRLLTAENITESTKQSIKDVLAPVVALGLPVLGVISDAFESQLQAVAELWPGTPHQICQFHAIREAGRLIYVLDHRLKTDMRIRRPRKDAHLSSGSASADADCASPGKEAVGSVGKLCGHSGRRFKYRWDPSLRIRRAGDARSSRSDPQQPGSGGKKRAAVTAQCQKRLRRLITIVNWREEKRAALEQVRQMREWVLKAEHILDGSWASELSEVSNAEVGRRLDEWLFELRTFLGAEERTEEEQLRRGSSAQSDESPEAWARAVL